MIHRQPSIWETCSVPAAAMSKPRQHCTRQSGSILHLRRLGTISVTCSSIKNITKLPSKACARRPDNSDAMFNLALLLQRKNQCAEAADYWRRYLAIDGQSEWASRARRSLKFCEMQQHLIV